MWAPHLEAQPDVLLLSPVVTISGLLTREGVVARSRSGTTGPRDGEVARPVKLGVFQPFLGSVIHQKHW